ncbi:MAG: helix-turn-helix domain-containing protein [Acetatifactor sp.]
MEIYEKIFARLEELHMTQLELSRRTGIATSTICDWKKKKINPQSDKLVSICKALEMSLVDLLCDEEEKKNNVLTADYMNEDKLIIEALTQASSDVKRRVLRYFELINLMKTESEDINQSISGRNVSVIQDADGKNC